MKIQVTATVTVDIDLDDYLLTYGDDPATNKVVIADQAMSYLGSILDSALPTLGTYGEWWRIVGATEVK